MENKKKFLLTTYFELLRTLKPTVQGEWGMMNPHQMVEHMAYSFRLANGKLAVEKQLTAEEHIPRLQSWLSTEKPMKENIQNPLIPQLPMTPVHSNYEDSILELEQEVKDMFLLFDQQPNLVQLNPFYGQLSNQLYTNLLFKHAIHHLKQFGISVNYIND